MVINKINCKIPILIPIHYFFSLILMGCSLPPFRRNRCLLSIFSVFVTNQP